MESPEPSTSTTTAGRYSMRQSTKNVTKATMLSIEQEQSCGRKNRGLRRQRSSSEEPAQSEPQRKRKAGKPTQAEDGQSAILPDVDSRGNIEIEIKITNGSVRLAHYHTNVRIPIPVKNRLTPASRLVKKAAGFSREGNQVTEPQPAPGPSTSTYGSDVGQGGSNAPSSSQGSGTDSINLASVGTHLMSQEAEASSGVNQVTHQDSQTGPSSSTIRSDVAQGGSDVSPCSQGSSDSSLNLVSHGTQSMLHEAEAAIGGTQVAESQSGLSTSTNRSDVCQGGSNETSSSEGSGIISINLVSTGEERVTREAVTSAGTSHRPVDPLASKVSASSLSASSSVGTLQLKMEIEEKTEELEEPDWKPMYLVQCDKLLGHSAAKATENVILLSQGLETSSASTQALGTHVQQNVDRRKLVTEQAGQEGIDSAFSDILIIKAEKVSNDDSEINDPESYGRTSASEQLVSGNAINDIVGQQQSGPVQITSNPTQIIIVKEFEAH